jgi:hypothetical protein
MIMITQIQFRQAGGGGGADPEGRSGGGGGVACLLIGRLLWETHVNGHPIEA